MKNETNELKKGETSRLMKQSPRTRVPLLFPELSYKFQGACFEVRKQLGGGHKKIIYERALAEEMGLQDIPFKQQPKIKTYYPNTHKMIGYYQPDFIIDNKIIIELKALNFVPKKLYKQLYDYLRVTKYELGYLVNFAAHTCILKRCLMTNNTKTIARSALDPASS